MLPSTITLNVGSPAADVVYGPKQTLGSTSIFYAPSPNSDLAGRPTLRVSHETTKSGVVRTLIQVRKPVLDAVTGKYVKPLQANLVLQRDGLSTLAEADEVLETIQEFLAVTDVRDALVGESN